MVILTLTADNGGGHQEPKKIEFDCVHMGQCQEMVPLIFWFLEIVRKLVVGKRQWVWWASLFSAKRKDNIRHAKALEMSISIPKSLHIFNQQDVTLHNLDWPTAANCNFVTPLEAISYEPRGYHSPVWGLAWPGCTWQYAFIDAKIRLVVKMLFLS